MRAESLLTAVLGVPLVFYAVRGWARFRRPAKWPVVQATIRRSSVVEIEIDIGEGSIQAWEPRIEFSYAAGNTSRSSTCVCLDDQGFQYTSHLLAQRFIARYPVGREVPAHLSPEGKAVLLADVNWRRKSHYLAWALFGALIFAFAVFLTSLP